MYVIILIIMGDVCQPLCDKPDKRIASGFVGGKLHI